MNNSKLLYFIIVFNVIALIIYNYDNCFSQSSIKYPKELKLGDTIKIDIKRNSCRGFKEEAIIIIPSDSQKINIIYSSEILDSKTKTTNMVIDSIESIPISEFSRIIRFLTDIENYKLKYTDLNIAGTSTDISITLKNNDKESVIVRNVHYRFRPNIYFRSQ